MKDYTQVERDNAALTIREYAFGQMNMLRMLGDEDAANNLQQAINVAIAALREKAEREAGCEWCTKLTNLSYSDASYYDDIRACVGMQKDIHILERHKKDDYVLNISSHAGNWIDYPIHYCPMCGRQLSGNAEQVKECVE